MTCLPCPAALCWPGDAARGSLPCSPSRRHYRHHPRCARRYPRHRSRRRRDRAAKDGRRPWVGRGHLRLHRTGHRRPDAYMVGQAAARTCSTPPGSRPLRPLKLDHRTVVWGHSQGGHAAIWTGIVGPAVRARPEDPWAWRFAPATTCTNWRTHQEHHLRQGRLVLTSPTPGPPTTAVGHEQADHPPLRYRIPDRPACFTGEGTLSPLPRSLSDVDPILTSTALSAHWPICSRQHPRPDGPGALLVAQGETDQLVLPKMQQQWWPHAALLGKDSLPTYFRPGHLALVAPSSPLTPNCRMDPRPSDRSTRHQHLPRRAVGLGRLAGLRRGGFGAKSSLMVPPVTQAVAYDHQGAGFRPRNPPRFRKLKDLKPTVCADHLPAPS